MSQLANDFIEKFHPGNEELKKTLEEYDKFFWKERQFYCCGCKEKLTKENATLLPAIFPHGTFFNPACDKHIHLANVFTLQAHFARFGTIELTRQVIDAHKEYEKNRSLPEFRFSVVLEKQFEKMRKMRW